MPIFESLSDVFDYVRKETMVEIADEGSKVSEEKLNARVEQNLYAKVNTSDDFYQNTYGLRNSAMSHQTRYGNGVENNGLLVDVFLEPKGNYQSYYGGQSQIDNIVEFIDQGHGGYYKGVKIDYEGRNIFDDTMKDLKKGGSLKKTIQEKLKRLGYVITRR